MDRGAPGIVAADAHLGQVQGEAGKIPPDDVHWMLGAALLERQVLGPVGEGGKPEPGLAGDEKPHPVPVADRHPARVAARPEFLRSHVGTDPAGNRGLVKAHEGGRLPVPVIFLGAAAEPLDKAECRRHGQPHADAGQLGQLGFSVRGEIVGDEDLAVAENRIADGMGHRLHRPGRKLR